MLVGALRGGAYGRGVGHARQGGTPRMTREKEDGEMLYAFGNAILDPQRHELRCAGVPVKLESKAYQILAYLVHHHDRVVSRQELLAEFWPDVNVHGSAVARCISAIRRAVGDRQDSQRVIRTVHGKGYRCIVPVLTYYPCGLPEAEGSIDTWTHPAAPVDVSGGAEAIAAQHCPACRCVNAPAARFCTACGTPLPVSCPACRHRIARPAAFCPACGNRLPSSYGLPPSRG